MNLLLMIIAALTLLLILRGYKKGLFKSAVSMIGIVLAVFLTTLLYPFVNTLLCDYSSLDESIKAGIEERFQIDTEAFELTRAEEMQVIEEIRLPENVKEWIIEKGTKENLTEFGAKNFNDFVVIYLSDLILKGVSYVITFLVLMLAVFILIAVSNIVTSIPIVHGIDKLGGVFFGMLQALLLVWIAFVVITLLSAFETCSVLMEMVGESSILTWIYEKNIFLKIMVDILNNI